MLEISSFIQFYQQTLYENVGTLGRALMLYKQWIYMSLLLLIQLTQHHIYNIIYINPSNLPSDRVQARERRWFKWSRFPSNRFRIEHISQWLEIRIMLMMIEWKWWVGYKCNTNLVKYCIKREYVTTSTTIYHDLIHASFMSTRGKL